MGESRGGVASAEYSTVISNHLVTIFMQERTKQILEDGALAHHI